MVLGVSVTGDLTRTCCLNEMSLSGMKLSQTVPLFGPWKYLKPGFVIRFGMGGEALVKWVKDDYGKGCGKEEYAKQ